MSKNIEAKKVVVSVVSAEYTKKNFKVKVINYIDEFIKYHFNIECISI